ncbi:MAG: hypothetical protein IJ864_06230 [Alphaproteobacteria bacterium]|nr:hypothetical protein [Alphaproteobacteria bacterium]
MNKQDEIQPLCVQVGNFQVTAVGRLELNQTYGLVRGYELRVIDGQGQVIYENIRGFLPLSDGVHLVRHANGVWVLVYLKRNCRERRLKKVNLRHGGLCLLFDERGKIHYAQESPHYDDINA